MTRQLMTDSTMELYKEGVLFGYEVARKLNAKQLLFDVPLTADQIVEIGHQHGLGDKNHGNQNQQPKEESEPRNTSIEKPAYLRGKGL